MLFTRAEFYLVGRSILSHGPDKPYSDAPRDIAEYCVCVQGQYGHSAMCFWALTFPESPKTFQILSATTLDDLRIERKEEWGHAVSIRWVCIESLSYGKHKGMQMNKPFSPGFPESRLSLSAFVSKSTGLEILSWGATVKWHSPGKQKWNESRGGGGRVCELCLWALQSAHWGTGLRPMVSELCECTLLFWPLRPLSVPSSVKWGSLQHPTGLLLAFSEQPEPFKEFWTISSL